MTRKWASPTQKNQSNKKNQKHKKQTKQKKKKTKKKTKQKKKTQPNICLLVTEIGLKHY